MSLSIRVSEKITSVSFCVKLIFSGQVYISKSSGILFTYIHYVQTNGYTITFVGITWVVLVLVNVP